MKQRSSRSKDTERTPEWLDEDEPSGSRFRFFLVPAIVLVIVLALVYFLQAGETDAVGASTQVFGGKVTGAGPKVGAPALDFSLPNLDGKATALSSFKGKVVMLNFFATWCPPCRAEMPDLVATYKDSKDKGFEIVAVDLQEDKAAVSGYAKSLGIDFTVLLDSNATVFGQYHVNGLPTSVFIDRSGTVQEIVIGGLNKKLITQRLDKLLQP
ncbi:MAG: TlpA disulfide reductase family protein [Dehalococcoidia bacterium]|nr:TlpA disulfide reductase family protein [Dehalococcoidia bacterium]